MDIVLIGTGEYTTGYVHDNASKSDKAAGVVALTCFDLKRLGLINKVVLAGTNGSKFPGIKDHFHRQIVKKYPGSNFDVTFEHYPKQDVVDPKGYLEALDSVPPGSMCTIFTPDDTHFEIAMAAVERGLHILLTKPPVQTLEQHHALAKAAKAKGVFVGVELHKRFDPIYEDAKNRIRGGRLGDLSYFHSYMSQPSSQLATFKHWVGRSDISYYLNAHHIDFHCWAMSGLGLPDTVVGVGSTGVACSEPFNANTEDCITLTVQWRNVKSNTLGTAVYTASWAAAKGDAHSQQRFFFLGQKGEISVDQARRGYHEIHQDSGYATLNPLFMRYTPTDEGKFVGQSGYGYRSIEAFVRATDDIRRGVRNSANFDAKLPTIHNTLLTTAILEAGRKSLDNHGCPYRIVYEDDVPIRVDPVAAPAGKK
eukprot:Rmarinus@m.1271